MVYNVIDGKGIIPDDVTIIDGLEFRGCTSLQSIIIPDGVTKIEGGAFEECISLQSITISTRNKVPFLAHVNIEQTH